MFDITFLGTAASVPSADRGLPALLVEHGPQRFLVDCGEGTQRQLIKSGRGFRRLDKLLLTHGHVDHLLGLGGFAATLALWDAADRLTVYAGRRPLQLGERLLREIIWPGGAPPLALAFVELAPGPFLDADGLRVTAFPVRHSGPDSFGFRFAEAAHRPLLADRLAALGVPSGPPRSQLARGAAVTSADGRRIDPEDVLGPPKPGLSIAVVGDTESVEELVEPVRGADLLVIEATFLDADADKARVRSHLTVGQAAWLARAAGVGQLCLTHISSRYPLAAIEAQARAAFPNSRVAQDFDRIRVER